MAQQPISRRFSALLAQALAKNPAERFADAKAMRQALETHRDDQVAPITHLGPGLSGPAARPESGVLLGRILQAAAAPLPSPSTSSYRLQPAPDPPTVREAPQREATLAQAIQPSPQPLPLPLPQPSPDPPQAPNRRWLWLAGLLAVLLTGAVVVLNRGKPEAAGTETPGAQPVEAGRPQPATVMPAAALPPEFAAATPLPAVATPAAAAAAPAPAPAETPASASGAAKPRPPRFRAAPPAAGASNGRPRVQPRFIND